MGEWEVDILQTVAAPCDCFMQILSRSDLGGCPEHETSPGSRGTTNIMGRSLYLELLEHEVCVGGVTTDNSIDFFVINILHLRGTIKFTFLVRQLHALSFLHSNWSFYLFNYCAF